MSYLFAALAVLAGVAAVVAGGADDSPGLQGIGLLLVAGTIVLVMRGARWRRSSTGPTSPRG